MNWFLLFGHFSRQTFPIRVPTWLLLRRTLPHRSSQQPLQLWPVLPASELVSRAAELVEERSLVLRLEGGGSWLIVYVWCVYVCGRIIPAPGGKKPTAFCFLEKLPQISCPEKLPLTIFFVYPRRRMNRIGVLFSSFAVKDEDNIRHRRDSLPNLHK